MEDILYVCVGGGIGLLIGLLITWVYHRLLFR